MSLEDFFTGLLPSGSSREDLIGQGRETLLADFRDLLVSGGPHRSVLEIPRELSDSSAAINLFRILEGRRPQTSLRIDSRDLISIPENSSDAAAAVAASIAGPVVHSGPFFGTLESAMQIRRAQSRHPLLEGVEDEHHHSDSTTDQQALLSLRRFGGASGHPYLTPDAIPTDRIPIPGAGGILLPSRRSPSTGSFGQELSIAPDQGMLSNRSIRTLSDALLQIVSRSLVEDEAPGNTDTSLGTNVNEYPSVASMEHQRLRSRRGRRPPASENSLGLETADHDLPPLIDSDGEEESGDFLIEEGANAVSTAEPQSADINGLLTTEQAEEMDVNEANVDIVDVSSTVNLPVPPVEREDLEFHGASTSANRIDIDTSMSLQDVYPPAPPDNTAHENEQQHTTDTSAVENPVASSNSTSQSILPGEPRFICPEGYEQEVFYSLPPELQAEIVNQHNETSEQTRALVEAAGFDLETINALPENIRQEILDQARRDLDSRQPQASTPTVSNENDNATFLLSLSSELRAEVLLTAEPAFLATLPPELVAEAATQRERAAARWQQREMLGSNDVDEDDEEEGPPRRMHSEFSLPRTDGRMLLPNDDISEKFVPDALVMVFCRVILRPEFPLSPNLHRVLHNMTKCPSQRDLLVRVLTSLMMNDKSLAARLVGFTDQIFEVNASESPRSTNLPMLTVATTAKRTNMNSRVVNKRILSTLRNLAVSNASVVYEFLRCRTIQGEASEDTSCGESSNSLLDMLMRLFSQDVFDSTAELLEFVMFIDLLCSPLESISLQDRIDEPVDPSSIGTVEVPQVRVSRDSVNCICELLLNDACTKSASKHIVSIMTRLGKIAENRKLIADITSEVILLLGSQSQERLEKLTHLFESEKWCNDKGRRSSSAAQFGEIGTKQHECLLQALQVFLALSESSETTLICSINGVWDALDIALVKLHGLEGITKEDVSRRSRPLSWLTSILVRILPVVEAFFLLHTYDLLHRKFDAKDDKKDSDVSNQSKLFRMNSLPGSSARNTAEYQQLNIAVAYDNPDDRGLKRNRSLPHIGSAMGASRTQRLVTFVQTHSNIINLLIAGHSSLLEGSLSAMVRVVPLRAHLFFDNKRTFFFNQLQRKNGNTRSRRGIHIQVRRGQIFEDSFHQLRDRSKEDMRGRLQVSFHGEEGVDAGGLTREWYLTLSKEIFNPNYALFSPVDSATFQPNPLSFINSNHLDYFKFVGRIIGKAISDGHLMDAHFTRCSLNIAVDLLKFSRSFYKHVLGAPVDYNDLEALEPEYYNSLKAILEVPIEALGLELTFSAETQTFGKVEIIDLVSNGRNIPVTDENKFDYVQLVAQHRMTTGIKSQIDAFLRGFYELVPAELISIFSPTELELLICGLPDVDIDELRINTEYHQYRATDTCIQWFWEVLKGFSREDRALFLLFVTGTSKVRYANVNVA